MERGGVGLMKPAIGERTHAKVAMRLESRKL